ncbi:MAG: hypothetical protein KW804_01360 [Candidatus Doudnabacteria bacterium]|nr:hypothetical protein [Candidatus Doudnabacteria bacterium]
MQIIKSLMRNVWLKKHLFGGAAYLVVIFSIIIAGIYYWQYSSSNIIDQIVHDSNLNCNENVPIKARNKYSGEVKEFPNSCKFPRGWEKVITASAENSENGSFYKNADYGFALGIPTKYKDVNYGFNGKTDYIALYLSEGTDANLMIYPKGGQDLLIPNINPVENSFSTIGGFEVRIKRWNLADGRTLVRYVFIDKVNSNWNTCKDPDMPDSTCNRVDLYASSEAYRTELIRAVSSMSFFKLAPAPKTSETVYYYAGDKLRLYNPSTSKETLFNLSGLDQFATIKKINDSSVAYLNQDHVIVYDTNSQKSETIFAGNTENGVTFIPDNFVVSPDQTKIAIGYRYGSNSNLDNCGSCSGVKTGVIVVNLKNYLTTASFDLLNKSTPIRWLNYGILLENWSGNYSAVTDNGMALHSYVVPDDIRISNSTNPGYVRIDQTKAVDIRNQKDRFGTASYLVVNGKVVYKGALGSINLVQN